MKQTTMGKSKKKIVNILTTAGMAVSYTHLDVYKRQIIPWTMYTTYGDTDIIRQC